MNAKLKKILKYLFIGLTSTLLVVFLAIGIAFNFVLTPEKITPAIVQALNENLDATLKINSVELKFFSTLPNLSLDMERTIIIKQPKDSILKQTYTKQDTLITFESGRLTINPLAFLFQKKIDIEHLIIDQPRIYAHVDSNGKANWDILKIDPKKDTISVEKEKGSYQADIEIDDITINKGDLYYDDENIDFYASTEGLDINLHAIFNKASVLLDLKVETENFIFWKEGDLLVEDLSFGLAGILKINRSNKIVDLDQTKVRIDDIVLVANGQVIPNKQKEALDIQLNLGLDVPSLKTFVELIPKNVLERRKDFKPEGTVNLQAKIMGIYGNGQLPILQASMTVKDGSIAYKKMPNKIDLIETNISAFLDPNKDKPSSINVHNFKIKGDGIALLMKGMVEDALGDAKVTASADGTINFAALKEIFPFKEGIQLRGDLNTDIKGTFYPRDIVNKNYGNIYALGKLSLADILLTYKTDSLIFATKHAKAVFLNTEKSKLLTEKSSKVLGGSVDLSEIKMSIKNKINASADSVFFEFGTTPWKDKTQIATMRSTVRINNAQFNLNDSVEGFVKKANVNLDLNPSVEDKSVPAVHSEFTIDSTGIIANDNFFAITDGNYNLDLSRNDDKKWASTGQITFNKLYAYTPTFPLLMKMPKTKITISPGLIELNHAKIEIGRSDIEVSGKIYDFRETIFEEKDFRAELAVESNVIDANELISTLNKGAKLKDTDIEVLLDEPEKKNTSTDLKPTSFVIPKSIDFTFNSSISKVLFKDFSIDNVEGLITIKDQAIDLANLQMNTMKAKMVAKVRLSTNDDNNNSLAFDFKLAEIDLANLIELIPVLDSLMPMAKSFEGVVNFRIRGISKLNSNLEMVPPSIDAIARIAGKDLVVFDSEVFANLSKKLMFNNQETNKLDEISVEILIENKVVEVLPALVTIDRYEIAVGGKYNLDMTYDYQFSILKSPLPFKAGVDITGDDDDYEIKFTKAKYKYIFSDKERHKKKVDSTIIKRKQEILRELPF